MKLQKIKLNELSNADLNEMEMCRLLGGAGNCNCACAGSSTTATNSSFNNADDLTSVPTTPPPTLPPITYPECSCLPMDGTIVAGGHCPNLTLSISELCQT